MADDGFWPAQGGLAPGAERVTYGEEVAAEICARVAAGESVRSICADMNMPARSTVREWAEREVEFGEALRAAMRAAQMARRRADLERLQRARDNRGRWSTYTPEKGDEICRRLVEGETLIAIARDPEMPCYSTILNWCRRHPEFADDYAQARSLAADWLADEARENALITTPEWVWADRLKFDTLRWLAAKLAPRKYVERLVVAQVHAEAKAAEAAALPAAAETEKPKQLLLVPCRFEYTPEGECVVTPPRNSHEEAVWERVRGRPYDGPFPLTDEQRVKADAEYELHQARIARQKALRPAGGRLTDD